MKNYNTLGVFYDELMEDGLKKYYQDIIKKSFKGGKLEGKSIIDLGCGTGVLISEFADKNETVGVDMSANCLEVAKSRDKKTLYVQSDMIKYKTAKLFDLAICSFDTINHLGSYKDWEKMFAWVYNHLKPGGVFVFDYNTPKKFEEIDGHCMIRKISKGFVFMVTNKKRAKSVWDIHFFIKTKGEFYRHFFEKIEQTSYKLSKIKKSLKGLGFDCMLVKDIDGLRYFLKCKKTP